MLTLSESAVHVVAANSRTAISDYDRAYASSLRMAADAIDGLQESGLPAGHSQRLYRSFNDSFGKLMDGRNTLVSAIGQLQVIHKHSNQAELDAGCPWYLVPAGSDAVEAPVAEMVPA